MSLYRMLALPAVLTFAAACSDPSRPLVPKLSSALRVAACEGPATSLDPAIAATLPGHRGLMTQDDRWADLARRAPGGFAGVLYDDDGKPVLLLKDVSQAEAAKRALAPSFPTFDIAGAKVREARWDFAQLVDWNRYLMQHYTTWASDVTLIDNDEAVNRVFFGVADSTARDE